MNGKEGEFKLPDVNLENLTAASEKFGEIAELAEKAVSLLRGMGVILEESEGVLGTDREFVQSVLDAAIMQQRRMLRDGRSFFRKRPGRKPEKKRR